MQLKPLTLGRRLRFHHLELVREIAEAGTLGAAADRLHLSKPAVSKALHEVENLLGFALFERTAKGMRPTPAGNRVTKHARLLLHEFQHMVNDVATESGAVHGLLRLGMSPFLGLELAPELIVHLKRRQPQESAAIQISEGWLTQLIEKLLTGELDVVLALYSPYAVAGMDLGLLAIEPLRPEPMIAVVPRALKLKRKSALTWGDLADQPWILPPAATHLRKTVDDMFIAYGKRPPTPVVESTVLAANVRLAAAGLGLSVVSESAAAEQIAAGRLRPLRSLRPLPETMLVLMYRRVSALYLPWLEVLREVILERYASPR